MLYFNKPGGRQESWPVKKKLRYCYPASPFDKNDGTVMAGMPLITSLLHLYWSWAKWQLSYHEAKFVLHFVNYKWILSVKMASIPSGTPADGSQVAQFYNIDWWYLSLTSFYNKGNC